MPEPDMTAQVLAELAADGWDDMTPTQPAAPNEWNGRVCVQTVLCADEPVPDWIVTAEIMRAWDGRTWIVYATRRCESCGREDFACAPGLPPESDPRTMLMRAVSKFDDCELRHDLHCPGAGG